MCTHSDLLGFTKSSRCSTHAFPYSPTSAPSPHSFHLQVQASLVGTKFCLNQNQQIFRSEAGAILLPSLRLSVLPTCPSLSVPGELRLMDHYPGYLATYLSSPESLSSSDCFSSMVSDRQLALILVLDENLNLWTLLLGSNHMTLLSFGILTSDLVLDLPHYLCIFTALPIHLVRDIYNYSGHSTWVFQMVSILDILSF